MRKNYHKINLKVVGLKSEKREFKIVLEKLLNEFTDDLKGHHGRP